MAAGTAVILRRYGIEHSYVVSGIMFGKTIHCSTDYAAGARHGNPDISELDVLYQADTNHVCVTACATEVPSRLDRTLSQLSIVMRLGGSPDLRMLRTSPWSLLSENWHYMQHFQSLLI